MTTKWEYKVLEIKLNNFFGSKVPEDLGVKVDELASEGWRLDGTVPIIASGWFIFMGAYTERILLFFRRELEGSNA